MAERPHCCNGRCALINARPNAVCAGNPLSLFILRQHKTVDLVSERSGFGVGLLDEVSSPSLVDPDHISSKADETSMTGLCRLCAGVGKRRIVVVLLISARTSLGRIGDGDADCSEWLCRERNWFVVENIDWCTRFNSIPAISDLGNGRWICVVVLAFFAIVVVLGYRGELILALPVAGRSAFSRTQATNISNVGSRDHRWRVGDT